MSGEKRRHEADGDVGGESSRSSKQSRSVENEMEKISLPVSIDLETFVSSRKDELANLANVVKVKMRKLVSQQLPRHLRRRTVSHNKKRLPKRLQSRFNAEAAKETKRPSRLHRRRPRNLREEYERRSGSKRWLETHIWHAKRFRMIDRFGYRIPESSFDKSLRACYRGAAKYCLLNDISYHCCIQLTGSEKDICAILDTHTSDQTGLLANAKKYIEGVYQGRIWLYEAGNFPFGVLGEVSFMWRPRHTDNDERVFWVWCHPELREVLLKAFKDGAKTFEAQEGAGVKVEDLTGQLNRFRLTGPLAVRTLCETLTQDTSNQDVGLRISPDHYNDFWQTLKKHSLSASSFIRDGQIAGNVVLDPRLHMPTKRLVPSVLGAAEDQSISETDLSRLEAVPIETEIWDSEMRERVKQQMPTQDELNKLREKNLVPGTPLDLKEKESRIPIMVIFRSGCKENLGYGRGCDVIVPSGWGRQFFIGLNYRGARAAGLRDLNAVTRHSDRFVFPDDVPDSSVAQRYLEEETLALRERHFKCAPEKRPSFLRLGIFQAFEMPFGRLVASYADSEFRTDSPTTPRPFFVVRNRTILEVLACAAKSRKLDLRELRRLIQGLDAESALVPVKLISTGRGVPRRYARIYGVPESFNDCAILPPERRHSVPIPEGHCNSEVYACTMMIAPTDNYFPIIGIVASGDRNMTGKTATALGYITLNGLLKMSLTVSKKVCIAYRNQDVFNYHRVQMQVII